MYYPKQKTSPNGSKTSNKANYTEAALIAKKAGEHSQTHWQRKLLPEQNTNSTGTKIND